jgi:hypothetical protein
LNSASLIIQALASIVIFNAEWEVTGYSEWYAPISDVSVTLIAAIKALQPPSGVTVGFRPTVRGSSVEREVSLPDITMDVLRSSDDDRQYYGRTFPAHSGDVLSVLLGFSIRGSAFAIGPQWGGTFQYVVP